LPLTRQKLSNCDQLSPCGAGSRDAAWCKPTIVRARAAILALVEIFAMEIGVHADTKLMKPHLTS
jgi:hypothetical protein